MEFRLAHQSHLIQLWQFQEEWSSPWSHYSAPRKGREQNQSKSTGSVHLRLWTLNHSWCFMRFLPVKANFNKINENKQYFSNTTEYFPNSETINVSNCKTFTKILISNKVSNFHTDTKSHHLQKEQTNF